MLYKEKKKLENEIKILFCDVDETLDVKNDFLEYNKEAISNLRTKHSEIKLVLATGRLYSLAEKIINKIDLYNKPKEYIICGSGSVIYENYHKNFYM